VVGQVNFIKAYSLDYVIKPKRHILSKEPRNPFSFGKRTPFLFNLREDSEAEIETSLN